MEITLPLDKMTIEDKIKTMERLWTDLCKRAESVPSPSWHKDILKDREYSINDNKEQFMDWNEAQKVIEDNTK